MLFSKLLKALYEKSKYESVETLAKANDTNKGFIDRTFAGKHTTEKIDKIFNDLTQNLTIEDILFLIDMKRRFRENQIKQKQIL